MTKSKKDLTSGSIFFNSLQQMISTVINRLGGLIFTVIVARLLSPESFGVYSLALSIMLLTLTVADLGLGQTLIRYVSDSLGKKDKVLARSYFKFLFRIRLLSTFVFSLLLFVLSNAISNFIFKNPDLILPIKFSAFYLLVVSILDFITFTFYSVKDVKSYTVREVIFQVIRIITLPLLILVLATNLGSSNAFIALIVASIFALVVSLIIFRKKYSFLFKGKVKLIDKKRLFRFAILLMIGILPGVFFTYIDSLMLGVLLPVEFVGFYRTAYMVATSAGALLMFYLVLLPFFTQLKGNQLRNTFKKIFQFVSIIAFPLSFGVALLSEPFIKVLFGQEYTPATLPLSILAFIILDIALFTYFTAIFQAKEKPEVPTKLVAISAVLNVILNFFLIKYFASIRIDLGMVGAALATFISRYFYGITIMIAAKKQLKLSPDAASIYKPLIASILMAIFIITLPSPTNIFQGVLFIFLSIIFYFIALYFLKGIRKNDFLTIKNLILSSKR